VGSPLYRGLPHLQFNKQKYFCGWVGVHLTAYVDRNMSFCVPYDSTQGGIRRHFPHVSTTKKSLNSHQILVREPGLGTRLTYRQYAYIITLGWNPSPSHLCNTLTSLGYSRFFSSLILLQYIEACAWQGRHKSRTACPPERATVILSGTQQLYICIPGRHTQAFSPQHLLLEILTRGKAW